MNDTIYACEKCPRRFFKEYRYEAHLRHHLGYKGFLCKHCNMEFKKADTFNVHMEAKHYDATQGKPEYICDFDRCGKKYARKVRNNVNIHSFDELFLIDFPLLSFRNRYVFIFNLFMLDENQHFPKRYFRNSATDIYID